MHMANRELKIESTVLNARPVFLNTKDIFPNDQKLYIFRNFSTASPYTEGITINISDVNFLMHQSQE